MHKPTKTPLESLGYEKQDVTAGPLVIGVISLFAFLGIMALVGLLFYNYFGVKEPAVGAEKMTANADKRIPPIDHRLQGYPVKDMESFRKAEDLQIENYQWKDKPKGVVAIPLERAVELIAERGLPTHQKMEPGNPTLKPEGSVGAQPFPEKPSTSTPPTGAVPSGASDATQPAAH